MSKDVCEVSVATSLIRSATGIDTVGQALRHLRLASLSLRNMLRMSQCNWADLSSGIARQVARELAKMARYEGKTSPEDTNLFSSRMWLPAAAKTCILCHRSLPWLSCALSFRDFRYP